MLLELDKHLLPVRAFDLHEVADEHLSLDGLGAAGLRGLKATA